MSKVIEISKFTVVSIVDDTVVRLLIERSSIRVGVEVLIADSWVSSQQEERIAPSEDMSYLISSLVKSFYS